MNFWTYCRLKCSRFEVLGLLLCDDAYTIDARGFYHNTTLPTENPIIHKFLLDFYGVFLRHIVASSIYPSKVLPIFFKHFNLSLSDRTASLKRVTALRLILSPSLGNLFSGSPCCTPASTNMPRESTIAFQHRPLQPLQDDQHRHYSSTHGA